MDYANSLKVVRNSVLSVFAVPAALVGEQVDVNRASYEAALRGFAENVVNPSLRSLSAAFTRAVAKSFGDDITIEFEPVVVHDVEERRESVETLLRFGAMTPDEAREILLDLPPLPSGTGPRVSASTVIRRWSRSTGRS